MTDHPDKPKRRRFFRFTLRTALLLLTLACVVLGWKVNKARQQREAVAWVEEMGGEVMYDYEYEPFMDDGPGVGDANPPGPAWLRHLVGIDFLAKVRFVSLRTKPISDASPLAQLTDLEYLDLSFTNVGNVDPLAKLTDLKYLYMHGAQVGDVAPLANLSKLESLLLGATRVRDVTPVGRLASLTELDLEDTEVSDLPPLERLTKLNSLALNGTQIRNLAPLTGLTQLAYLRLDDTQVSEESLQKLQQALPNCYIYGCLDVEAVEANNSFTTSLCDDLRHLVSIAFRFCQTCLRVLFNFDCGF